MGMGEAAARARCTTQVALDGGGPGESAGGAAVHGMAGSTSAGETTTGSGAQQQADGVDRPVARERRISHSSFTWAPCSGASVRRPSRDDPRGGPQKKSSREVLPYAVN